MQFVEAKTEVPLEEQPLIDRLRIRAAIRRQVPLRKSVINGERDRIADLLEEAATELHLKDCAIASLQGDVEFYKEQLKRSLK